MPLHKENRLAQESSPYLQQHSRNPVDWYAWGAEALQSARDLDRPILLSIGYSSCHWCHVMEKESFEDEATARLMNDKFINVKVDREERPDIDSIYMGYVQMTTGHGGWPLTVFLTPDLLPFFGGTYFPPRDLPGRPGFRTVLSNVARYYHSHRDEVTRGRAEIVRALEQASYLAEGEFRLQEGTLKQAAGALLSRFDSRYGGFGGAPKFPPAMSLSFLMRTFARSGDPAQLGAVELTLDRMAKGGMYDQLGGGFHRYSVDERWFAPHFEKMLYDNALLCRTYLEAFQLTGKPEYRRVVEEILSYVQSSMTHPDGGFFSAEDADSEGEEGCFYVWSWNQLADILSPEQADLVAEFYGLEPGGNWEGSNILHQVQSLEALSTRLREPVESLSARLNEARRAMLSVRAKRVRPSLDDKVLASWNGLMLTALSEAAFVLDAPQFWAAARRNGEFLAREMIRGGRLMRTWKSGRSKLAGYLEDYAHVIEAFLTLFQVSGETVWLDRAQELTQIQIDLFYDSAAGDFYFTAADHEELLVRPKEHFDNATPSGNSTAAVNLLQLGSVTGDARYTEMATRMLERMAGALARYPTAFGNWLRALDFYLGPVKEIVLLGPVEVRRPLEREVRRSFLPRKILIVGDSAASLPSLPALLGKSTPAGEGRAFVCEAYACQEPVSDPLRLREQLGSQSARRFTRS